MTTRVQRRLLSETVWDSGALAGRAAVVHQMREPGEYLLEALRATQPTSSRSPQTPHTPSIRFTVDEDSPVTQVDVDLAVVARHPGRRPPLVVGVGGYVLLHAPDGRDGYAALITQIEERSPEPFDSRRLGPGDLFALTLLGAGTYRVTNSEGQHEGTIVVAYPEVGEEPYRPPEPQVVDVMEEGFDPESVALQPAQGLTFNVGTAARLRIELIEPASEERSLDRPTVARWRKPIAHDRAGGALS